jgi:flavin-dependent dehydrogenase
MQQRITQATLHSRRRSVQTRSSVPFLFTVNRVELGRWQRSLLEGSNVEIRTQCHVISIDNGEIVLKSGETLGFKYLVGADGYASIVRRHLGLKMKKRLLGYQYTLPDPTVKPSLDVFLDARRFHVWYAWIFPHRENIVVGCCCDPGRVDHLQLKTRFYEWLKEKRIDPGDAVLQSYPIGCDYRGYRFGNIYLAGEAAGMASWLTGEGIYQSLASGKEIARLIMDPMYDPVLLNKVLKYNRMLERIMAVFILAGPMKGMLQEFLVLLMNRKWFRDMINDAFS